MKTVVHTDTPRRKDKLLHIEAEGCIVNIRIGLTDTEGRAVTNIEILPDKYVGEEWDIDGDPKVAGRNIRVIRRKEDN